MFIRWSHAAHPRPLGSPTMSFHGPSGWRRTISIALRWDFDYLPGGIGRRALPVGVRDVAGRDLTISVGQQMDVYIDAAGALPTRSPEPAGPEKLGLAARK